MLRYELPITWPSLTISNYIYGEGDRSDQLIAENKVVHPLFCRRTLRALSA
jgi:prophage DNA circulation protein